MVHDDVATRIDSTTPGWIQDLNIDWPNPIGSLPAGFTFTFYGRFNTNGGAPTVGLRFDDESGTFGGNIASVNPVAWTTYGPYDVSNGVTHAPSGAAWEVVDLQSGSPYTNVRIGHSGVGTQARGTSVWGELEYTPPSGGFTFLLGIAGAAINPLVGSINDFATFMRFLEWRRLFHPRHTIMKGEEVLQAWRELKECKHVAYQF
jgi:hypothetical protein